VRISNALRQRAETGLPWLLSYVRREDDDEVAVLTIRRYRRLNALNQQILRELHEAVMQAEDDLA
jgi:enoyl-CoA hydratase/carnithine racemase